MKKKSPSQKSNSKAKSRTPPRGIIGGASGDPRKKTWRPEGKVIVKDTLHGAPHEIIETRRPVTMTAEQIKDNSENPLNKKAVLNEEGEMWKERALEAEGKLVKKLNEIETLSNGQMLPADKAAPMEVQKMKEQIIALQEKLSPFKYECVWQNTMISMMVRPRAREVIILSA